ncbi:hypothetical protein O9993_00030 [Vibrio lentus]|nr:hypothetical protein [Vibrio lentus]
MSNSPNITQEQRAQLYSLLDAYDNEATQCVTELLAQYPHSAVLKDVRSALDNYDFEQARGSRALLSSCLFEHRSNIKTFSSCCETGANWLEGFNSFCVSD